MPVDTRRLQGPDNSFSYKLLENNNAALESSVSQSTIQQNLLDHNGQRKDKRKANDARPLCMPNYSVWIMQKLNIVYICSLENGHCQPGERLSIPWAGRHQSSVCGLWTSWSPKKIWFQIERSAVLWVEICSIFMPETKGSPARQWRTWNESFSSGRTWSCCLPSSLPQSPSWDIYYDHWKRRISTGSFINMCQFSASQCKHSDVWSCHWSFCGTKLPLTVSYSCIL